MDTKDTHTLTLDFDRLGDWRKSQTSLHSDNGEETPFSFSEVSGDLRPFPGKTRPFDLITTLERA